MPNDCKYYRWVPRAHAAEALAKGFFTHNGSALWVFKLSKPYRPGQSITGTNAHPAVLLRYTLDEKARGWIEDGSKNITARGNGHEEPIPNHSQYEDWTASQGEASFPWQIIIKNNENGAFGIGRKRQGTFSIHCVTAYATKREVANALGRSEMEVGAEWKPPTGAWP